MAKKKNKKKEKKKKDPKKKNKGLKGKGQKKKETKKKALKKKDSKKKKKKAAKKKSGQKKIQAVNTPAQRLEETTRAPDEHWDHSSNYNVREAIKKLRTLKSPEEVNHFTKGETRISVNRVVPAVLRHFGT